MESSNDTTRTSKFNCNWGGWVCVLARDRELRILIRWGEGGYFIVAIYVQYRWSNEKNGLSTVYKMALNSIQIYWTVNLQLFLFHLIHLSFTFPFLRTHTHTLARTHTALLHSFIRFCFTINSIVFFGWFNVCVLAREFCYVYTSMVCLFLFDFSFVCSTKITDR